MDKDVLVEAENVSKKFCRSLKRSLWYGVADMAREVAGGGSHHDVLRPDEFWAVNDVTFQLRRGECLGLIGHNGAGKTTLLKMLNGLIKPDTGRITARGRMGALIALGAGFNPLLTGRENIYVNGSILGLTRSEIRSQINRIIDFAEINEFIDSPVQNYSSGMQVRLGFAIATAITPDILLLDEVLAVGDTAFQAKCFNTLAHFKKNGVAFILVSHNMHHIERYSDTVVYMKHGSVQFLGDAPSGIAQLQRDAAEKSILHLTSIPREPTSAAENRIVLGNPVFVAQRNKSVVAIDRYDSFALELPYECRSRLTARLLVDVVVVDREGVLLQDSSRDVELIISPASQAGRLKIAFPCMPAAAAKLLFHVAVFDRDTLELLAWKRNIPLAITGHSSAAGRLALDVTFSHSPDPPLC